MIAKAVVFLVLVVIAIVVTLIVVLRRPKDDGKNPTPPKTGAYTFTPTSSKPAMPYGKPAGTPRQENEAMPVGTTVMFQRNLSAEKKVCSYCSCEYSPAMQVCEICGRELQRR